MSRKLKRLVLTVVPLALVAGAMPSAVRADHFFDVLTQEPTLDPAHNIFLPCEAVSTPGAVPRSAENIAHVANACGFVGTDIEFQSRVDAQGGVRDFAFVGTMGAGTRIFDITDPAHPVWAGGYVDPGWQNDVQVRGNLLVIAFDPLLVGVNVSACLRQQNPTGSATRGGVDFVELTFDPATAMFQTALLGCYLNAAGGAHNATIHPRGEWLSIDTSLGNGIEVVDLRGNAFTLVRRIPSATVASPHDVFFSADGNTLYSAGVSSTRIVDIFDIFNQAPALVAVVPNAPSEAQGADGQTVQISHQADVSADGKLLVVSDEKGGGLSNTACNLDDEGAIGGLHFWALDTIDGAPASVGASAANPLKLGTWIYPNPGLAADPLEPVLEELGRTERACTIHVFRHGGNGTSSPGAIHPDFDGVSRLPVRELVSAHYGAGVWHIDFSSPPDPAAGLEDPRTTWGNTLGWNVMPGAETWSAKEYKGFIYAGDMARGFDVFSFTSCQDTDCVVVPANTPGRASGGGGVPNSLAELIILNGPAAGGRASFGLGVEFETGQPSPTGMLTFVDHGTKRRVQATSVDAFTIVGSMATFGGRAAVSDGTEVTYVVSVEDHGEPGNADTFRIVLGDGFAAGGLLLNGNIQVQTD